MPSLSPPKQEQQTEAQRSHIFAKSTDEIMKTYEDMKTSHHLTGESMLGLWIEHTSYGLLACNSSGDVLPLANELNQPELDYIISRTACSCNVNRFDKHR
jgi:hypothetical protein